MVGLCEHGNKPLDSVKAHKSLARWATELSWLRIRYVQSWHFVLEVLKIVVYVPETVY